ncbi:four-carbon acid sugar kinase family protein [Piscinibacter sakaiensis]|uniref:four-carbon acid sugar kinase family protein n=1 Tax=Piscinibacter sakaiensis TaxID=1547922 RepID=UPI003AAD1EEE
MAGPRLLFYGDDFTGSTDALEVLSLAGLRAALFLQAPDAAMLDRHPGLDAIGVAGDSRTMTPQEMATRFAPELPAMAAAGAPLVHYKVCSTFDSAPDVGSIGRVLELARPFFNGAVAVVAATPHLGRHCLYGNLFARSGTDGQVHRIDRHPIMSVHPVTPMREADLLRHIGQQTGLPIGLVTLDTVRAGADAMRERFDALQRDGFAAVLIDGYDSDDLRAAGQLLDGLGSANSPAFVVGGSGVEHALTLAWGLPRDAGVIPSVRPTTDGAPLLAVSGSASALSAMQIETAVQAGFEEVALDAARLAGERDWRAELDRAGEQAAAALHAGRSVIVHSARGPADPRVAAARQALAAAGGDSAQRSDGGAQLIANRIGMLVRQVVHVAKPPRIVISGGDTSSSVARALDVQAVEVAARLAPGAPLCRVLESSVVRGCEIAFKGGQMGSRDFIREARDGFAA